MNRHHGIDFEQSLNLSGSRPWQPHLADPSDLVHLQRQAPLRMVEAVLNGGIRVCLESRAIHWLEEEMGEAQVGKSLGHCGWLRIHQLELVASRNLKCGGCLGAHTSPVDAGDGWLGTIRLDGHVKTATMQC